MSSPVHILLVEDDEDDITLFKLALKKLPFPVTLTILTEGDEVLSYLNTATERPDLVFLDLNLPRMHGRDVLRQTKGSVIGRLLPVFILTTSSAQGDIDYCLAYGAEQFLTKPASLAELVAMLTEVLARVR